MRLPRSRKGKTTIDVTTTAQNGLKRVRLTMGPPNGWESDRYNTDMDEEETEALITLLRFTLAKLRGEVPDDV